MSFNSMTGYGKGIFNDDIDFIQVEMKSVNSKGLEVYVKMPDYLYFAESEVISYIKKKSSRGRVSVYIHHTRNSKDAVSLIDMDAAKSVYNQLDQLNNELNIMDEISLKDVLQLKSNFLISNSEKFSDETVTKEIKDKLLLCVKDAHNNFVSMRNREGEYIKDIISKYRDNIKELYGKIKTRYESIKGNVYKGLLEKVTKVFENFEVDKDRVYTEAALLSEKYDITEEIDRLGSHIGELNSTINHNSPIGKKIDFIMQEVNRESNTINSKINDFEIKRYILSMKNEIEKIREQIQNIE